MSETTVTTFEVVLPPPELSKADRERAAFDRLLPQLLQTHGGQVVAIHEGLVVDSGPDDVALIQRVHAKVGYVELCVRRGSRVREVVRVPRRREVNRAGAK